MSDVSPRTKVMNDIHAERVRQVEDESYTTKHDDEEHGDGELATAAACYASPDKLYGHYGQGDHHIFSDPWPWQTGHNRGEPCNMGSGVMKEGKPRRRQLVIAAALIVAEIERLDRAGVGS